jgi:predicted TIM-barrel fold metal-dependent hydrolase
MNLGEVLMNPYSGPIFDGDTHFYETDDAFSRYLPEKFKKDWEFHYESQPGGNRTLYIGNRRVEISDGYFSADGRVPPPGKLHEWLKAMKDGKSNVDLRVAPTADMYSLQPRLKKMDEFGVEACTLFLGEMVSCISYLDEPVAANEILHAYNRWMYDEWTFNYANRVYSTPAITLADLNLAIAEAEWLVAKGVRVIVMPMGPFNGRSPADPYFDPFWSILNEAGVRVTYHVSEAIYMKDHMAVWGEPVQQSRQRQSAFLWMHGYSERPVVETLSSFVFYNFFARFPNVKLCSAENGAEWVPNMLVKMDKSRGMARNGYWPCGQLAQRPSRIFKENVFVVAYPEDDVKSIIEQAGSADFLLMGSDYPHAEGVPTPQDFVTEALEGVSAADVRKVMYDNGRRFLPAG